MHVSGNVLRTIRSWQKSGVGLRQIQQRLQAMQARGVRNALDLGRLPGHAEIKHAVPNPNRTMIGSCQDFFVAEALFHGQQQIVVDQQTVITFDPDGTVTQFFHDRGIVQFRQTVTTGPNAKIQVTRISARTW
jgi:hypothetical protein